MRNCQTSQQSLANWSLWLFILSLPLICLADPPSAEVTPNTATTSFIQLVEEASLIAEEQKSRVVGDKHLLLALIKHLESNHENLAGRTRMFAQGAHSKLYEQSSRALEMESSSVPLRGSSSLPVQLLPFSAAAEDLIQLVQAQREASGDLKMGPSHLLFTVLEPNPKLDSLKRLHVLFESSPQLQIDQVRKALDIKTASVADASGEGERVDRVIEEVTKPLSPPSVEVIKNDREMVALRDFLVSQDNSYRGATALIGLPNSGKSSTLETFNARIQKGDYPEIRGYEVRRLDLDALIAGTKFRGEEEERFKTFLNEVTQSERKFVFLVDNITQYLDVDSDQVNGEDQHAKLIEKLRDAAKNGVFKLIYEANSDDLPSLKKKGLVVKTIDITEHDSDSIRAIIESIKQTHPQLRGHEIDDLLVQKAIKLSERFIRQEGGIGSTIAVITEALEIYRNQFIFDREGTQKNRIETLHAVIPMDKKTLDALMNSEKVDAVLGSIFKEIPSEGMDVAKLIRQPVALIEFLRLMAFERQDVMDKLPQPIQRQTRELLVELMQLQTRINRSVSQVEALETERAQKRAAIEEAQALLKELATLEVSPSERLRLILEGGAGSLSRRAQIENRLAELQEKFGVGYKALHQDHLAKAIESMFPEIPAHRVSPFMENSNHRALEALEQGLSSKVIGQDHLIRNLVEAERLSSERTKVEKGVRHVVVLAGDSGIGKTLISQTYTELLYGSKEKLLIVNMTAYNGQGAGTALFGSSPGHVDSSRPGVLTGHISDNPHAVVLLDEFDQANESLKEKILNAMLDTGFLEDSFGRKVDCRNVTLILTTNAQSEYIRAAYELGVDPKIISELLIKRFAIGSAEFDSMEHAQINARIEEHLNQTLGEKRVDNTTLKLKASVLGRIGTSGIIAGKPLSMDDLKAIASIELDKLHRSFEKLGDYGRKITLSPEVLDFLVEVSYSPDHGARKLSQLIDQRIIKPVLDRLGEVPPDSEIQMRMTPEGQVEYFSPLCQQSLAKISKSYFK